MLKVSSLQLPISFYYESTRRKGMGSAGNFWEEYVYTYTSTRTYNIHGDNGLETTARNNLN
jgi:hypothetical protein